MSDSVSAHAGHVHPLLHPDRFAIDIDYDRAIYPAAVLATRLLNSPQGLQHDYCFYFGKNVSANTLAAYGASPCYAEAFTGYTAPHSYATNKGIDRVRYELEDMPFGSAGGCDCQLEEEDVRGCDSVIKISKIVYQAVSNENRSPLHIARANFYMTSVLLNELAHAAHHHLHGPKCEDFRENSNVAETGFEFEARIFGAAPSWSLPHRASVESANYRAFWTIWQSHESLDGCHDLDFLTRNEWQLPTSRRLTAMDGAFILKLFDEDFWSGEYLERGALALIPDHIAEACRSSSRGILYKSIPLSIRDLFRSPTCPSYAQTKYASFANPERELRCQD